MPHVDSHGVRIHYAVRGDGPPVVLLHSFLCSGEMWRHQLEELADDYFLVNIDLRGHGASGRVEHTFDLYELVDDVTAVLDDLGIGKAVWAGLSVGGMTALRAALTCRERVTALALLDTDAGCEHPAVRLKYRALAGIARTLGLGAVRRPVVRQMFGRTTLAERPDLVAEWGPRFTSVHLPSALRVLSALVRRDDLTPRLQEITSPSLVLVGEEDTSLPPSRSQRLAAALPNAEFVTVPGAGHLSALERPSRVNAALADFLCRLDAS